MKYLKLLGFILTVSLFFLTTVPFYPLFLLSPLRIRKILLLQVSFYSQCLSRILNLKVTFQQESYLNQQENFLIVSNHLSYLDVIALAARNPSCFVTSQEIKKTPFLGQITTLAGCLFVDRKNRSQLKEEIGELRDALNAGMNVTVFPEATSTNGDEVLRFRRPLFESSIATGKAILPMTINYKKISGQDVSLRNRDLVCWYGDMDFFSHFLKVLEQSEVEIEIVLSQPFLPELMPSMELASRSHEMVSGAFRPLGLELANHCVTDNAPSII